MQIKIGEMNSIGEFYKNLAQYEKGKFILCLQNKLELSYTCIFSRIKEDNWRGIEREAVEDIIKTESWR